MILHKIRKWKMSKKSVKNWKDSWRTSSVRRGGKLTTTESKGSGNDKKLKIVLKSVPKSESDF